MKSILSLWQRWFHLDSLVKKRTETLEGVQNLSSEEVNDVLKREFKGEYPYSWVDMIIKPLAKDICSLDEFKHVEVHGPSGAFDRILLMCIRKDGRKSSIYLIPNLDPEWDGSILSKIDYTAHTGEFASGSPGDSLGLNNPEIALNNDFNGSDIAPYIND